MNFVAEYAYIRRLHGFHARGVQCCATWAGNKVCAWTAWDEWAEKNIPPTHWYWDIVLGRLP